MCLHFRRCKMEIVKIKSQVKVHKKRGGISFGCYTSKSLKRSSCLAYKYAHLFMASQEDLHLLYSGRLCFG